AGVAAGDPAVRAPRVRRADRRPPQGHPAGHEGRGRGVRPLGPGDRRRQLVTNAFSELRLDGVGRRFAGKDALADLDLTIRAGEFIALLGPSGCGKSTALNCLAGLLPLTSGSIWQDEKRIDLLPPEKRGFGMVFQNYALFP